MDKDEDKLLFRVSDIVRVFNAANGTNFKTIDECGEYVVSHREEVEEAIDRYEEARGEKAFPVEWVQ